MLCYISHDSGGLNILTCTGDHRLKISFEENNGIISIIRWAMEVSNHHVTFLIVSMPPAGILSASLTNVWVISTKPTPLCMPSAWFPLSRSISIWFASYYQQQFQECCLDENLIWRGARCGQNIICFVEIFDIFTAWGWLSLREQKHLTKFYALIFHLRSFV